MKIELKSVTKEYLYGAKVLSSVDLSIKNGEIVALLGNAGAGKTTLLKVIAGVEDVTSGEVLFDGAKMPLKSDDVQMLFDDGALFKRRDIFDNLAYPLKIRKVDKAEVASRVLRVADDLDMTPLLSLRPSQLNLAEKKRVSLARVLLRDSKVLLIDDIGANLDKVERESLWDELSRYLKSCGKTVVYATTQADEASSVADKIVAMSTGDIKQVGTAQDIYNYPQSIWAVELLDKNFTFDDATLLDCENAQQQVTNADKHTQASANNKHVQIKLEKKKLQVDGNTQQFQTDKVNDQARADAENLQLQGDNASAQLQTDKANAQLQAYNASAYQQTDKANTQLQTENANAKHNTTKSDKAVQADKNLCLKIGDTIVALPYDEKRLISKSYVGKSILFGAHAQDFEICANGVACDVELCKGLPNGEFLVCFSNGWKMKTSEKTSGTVKIAPKADKVFLFDKASEGSILKRLEK